MDGDKNELMLAVGMPGGWKSGRAEHWLFFYVNGSRRHLDRIYEILFFSMCHLVLNLAVGFNVLAILTCCLCCSCVVLSLLKLDY